MKHSVIKTTLILVIISLGWVVILGSGKVLAYFNDIETSSENAYSAGTLDFSLSTLGDFSSLLTPFQPSTKTIEVTNNGLLSFQYIIKSSEFFGELCPYLNLEANVDGGPVEYNGPLINFISPAIVFSSTEDWIFTLSFAQDLDLLQEENCHFKFIFQGWQENLSSNNQGFNDQEDILNEVTAGKWIPTLSTPLNGAVINGSDIKHCWTPINEATKYIYQSCNNNPDTDDHCDERFYEEYEEGETEFINTCKTDSNLLDGTYWWRVKAMIGSYQGFFSPVFKITIDNSRENKVVINEFLPNPIGPDEAPMPNGEWIELYNNKGEKVDVNNWVLYDAYDDHELFITPANTNTGNTLIPSGGFLVVYRNNDSDFSLNNIGGDTVRLYDGEIENGANLIDSYTYIVNAPEGKSFARIPDGSNNWVDPVPTPGLPNSLEGLENIIWEIVLPKNYELIDCE